MVIRGDKLSDSQKLIKIYQENLNDSNNANVEYLNKVKLSLRAIRAIQMIIIIYVSVNYSLMLCLFDSSVNQSFK